MTWNAISLQKERNGAPEEKAVLLKSTFNDVKINKEVDFSAKIYVQHNLQQYRILATYI